METTETKKPVVLTVIPCPEKKGYSIKHNQPIGWKGIVSYWFAWYKYKSDAVKAANELQMEYNKAAKPNLFKGIDPKYVRVYDNQGETLDRYTVVFTGRYNKKGQRKSYIYLGMNAAPFHPQGIGQHGESSDGPIDRTSYKHLGKRIEFKDLPEDCKKAAMQTYKSIWDIENK